MNIFGAAIEDNVFYVNDECVAGFGLGGSHTDGIAHDFDEGIKNMLNKVGHNWKGYSIDLCK